MQETEHLRAAVEELKRLKPDVLLVEKSVARDAQDALLDSGVSLALTMKRANLERLALCSGSTVSRSPTLLPSANSALLYHWNQTHHPQQGRPL